MGGESFVSGDQNEALLELTIPQALANAVARYPDQDAVVSCEQGISVSYREFNLDVDRLAGGLLTLGLVLGDRIGLWSPNRYEWMVAKFAAARIGLILVNINPAYRRSELRYALDKVGCKALIAAVAFKSSDYLAMLRELLPELAHCAPGQLIAAQLTELTAIIQLGDEPEPGMFRFAEILARGDAAQRAKLDAITAQLRPEDAISIQFTSGTTGQPKGAALTHHNLVNNGYFSVKAIGLTEVDRLCLPVPLYHCFGMVCGALGCVIQGGCLVLPGEAFDAVASLRAVEAERCTALYGVPTMFVSMLEAPEFEAFDLSSLRTGTMAGAPCPIEVMKKVISLMHMPEVTIAYGMTETSPVTFQSAIDDPVEKRVSTIGRVHPHAEAKIVDEQGNMVAVGEQGELWARGYCVMLGYWQDDQRTRDTMADGGWMKTGDLARMDADGYCNIVGRSKDMIIRGGENIYPREIEEHLYLHANIQQVQVFGIPHERLGEEVCVWIILKPGETVTEQDIKDFCAAELAYFKVPKHIRFVAELPMTVSGKPQKFRMRELMMQELNRSAVETA